MPPSKVRLSCSLGARPLRAMLSVAHRAAMLDSYSPPAQNGPSLPHRHHFRVLKVCQLAPAPSCSDSAADLPSAGQAASQPYWSQGTQRRPVTVAARVTHTVHNVQTRTAHLQARPCAAQTARPWGSWSCSPARAWRCRRPRWSRGSLVLLLLWGRALEAASQVGDCLCCLPQHLRWSTGSTMMQCGAGALGRMRQHA